MALGTGEGFQRAPGAEVKSKSFEEDHQVAVSTYNINGSLNSFVYTVVLEHARSSLLYIVYVFVVVSMLGMWSIAHTQQLYLRKQVQAIDSDYTIDEGEKSRRKVSAVSSIELCVCTAVQSRYCVYATLVSVYAIE